MLIFLIFNGSLNLLVWLGMQLGWCSAYLACTNFWIRTTVIFKQCVEHTHTYRPSTQEVKKKDHNFKEILHYMASLRVAWRTWDPVSNFTYVCLCMRWKKYRQVYWHNVTAILISEDIILNYNPQHQLTKLQRIFEIFQSQFRIVKWSIVFCVHAWKFACCFGSMLRLEVKAECLPLSFSICCIWGRSLH